MTLLDDGVNILGAGTPRAATTTDPAGDVDPDLVRLVADLTIDEIETALAAGDLTIAEVAAAEDPDNGGRGRAGVRDLTGD